MQKRIIHADNIVHMHECNSLDVERNLFPPFPGDHPYRSAASGGRNKKGKVEAILFVREVYYKIRFPGSKLTYGSGCCVTDTNGQATTSLMTRRVYATFTNSIRYVCVLDT